MLRKTLGPTVSELNCGSKGPSGALGGLLHSWERHVTLRVSFSTQENELVPVK